MLFRSLLLSPHPGQVKAEINSVPRGQENSNEAAALGREIHDMLFADPYCPSGRAHAIDAARKAGWVPAGSGTLVVVAEADVSVVQHVHFGGTSGRNLQ